LPPRPLAARGSMLPWRRSPAEAVSSSARTDGTPPSWLAEDLRRPLLPQPGRRPFPRLHCGEHLLWDVPLSSRTALAEEAEHSSFPGAARSRSCPIGYQEYQIWLQRSVDGIELREEETEEEQEDLKGLSGLELLRKLCAPKKPLKPGVKLTPEERDVADDVLHGDGSLDDVIASRFSVSLTRGQMQCLLPCTWLNDEVINFYYKLLQERTTRSPSGPKCWFTNSFFWNKLSGGPNKRNDEYGFKEVRRWTTKAKVDIFALDYVIFPMNIGEMHWAMGAIDIKEKGFRYFDSFISKPHPNFVPFLRRYLDDEHKGKKGGPLAGVDKWNLIEMENVPQQHNGYDCGVFTCFFGDRFSAGRPLDFDQDDMPDLRTRLTARVAGADENWTTP
jgi:hypothetical protein